LSNRVGILLYINYNIIFFQITNCEFLSYLSKTVSCDFFVRDILSVTFCPMTLCPICRKMSVATFCPVTFCPWPFVYGFLSCDFLSYIIWLNTRLVFEPRIYRTWFLKFNIMKWIERIRKLVIKVFVQFVNICYEVNVESFGFGVF
jgi:hypothetical protein